MDHVEYLLSTNEFNNPKKLKDKDAIGTLLVRLILLEPGTYRSHPEMGIGLRSKYRYAMQDEVPNIQTNIEEQIRIYLPMYEPVDVKVSLSPDKELIIDINIDGTLYKYETEKQENNNIGLIDLQNY